MALIRLPKNVMAQALMLAAVPWPRALANPDATESTLPKDLQVIMDIADMYSSFCAAAPDACQGLAVGEDEAGRRHLSDDASMPYRILEGQVRKLLEKDNLSKDGDRRRLEGCGFLCQAILGCAFETLGCHLYLDNLFMPPVEDYVYNDVCLADEGEEGGCEDATDVKAIKFVDKIDDIQENEFLYQGSGPPQLQGVFALEYSPCQWSSLVTFAKTRESSGGIATGTLGDTGDFLNFDDADPNFGVVGPLRAPQNYAYAIRVLGDHNWAFGSGVISFIAQAGVILLDLVYKFVLLDGTLDNPTKFQIIPDIKIPFTCIRLEIKGCLENLVRFEMTLIENCDDIPQEDDPLDSLSPQFAYNACVAGAVVWRRDSWFFGSGPDSYFVVQVVDGDGDTIDATWPVFVDGQQACKGDADDIYTTNSFASLGGKGGADAGFCHCAYTGDLPYGLDNFAGPFGGDSKKRRGLRANRRNRRGSRGQHSSGTRKNSSRKKDAVSHRELSKNPFEDCPRYSAMPSTSPAPSGSPQPSNAPSEGKGSKRRRQLEMDF